VIEICAESQTPGAFALEIAQHLVSLPDDANRQFSEPGIAHRGNLVAPLAASVLRAVTGRYSGKAELIVDPDVGSTIHCSFQL
jgi:hypothetical protein